MTKLIHGDCIEEMAKMDAGSVDLTVTSPPYDNLRTYEGSLQWNEDIWKRVLEGLYRVTKDGGVVVWVVGDSTINGSETGSSFRQALFFKECGFRLHDTMIYGKNQYMPLTHNRYEQAFEYMFVFSKGKPKTFNPIMVDCVSAGGKKYRGNAKQYEANYSERKREETTITKATKQKNNVWFLNVGNASGDDKTLHNAPFPEQLTHDHIISWSNEGDTVFDPFMGSGTTGKMAKQLGRSFIGIEKVEKYYDIAKERISH